MQITVVLYQCCYVRYTWGVYAVESLYNSSTVGHIVSECSYTKDISLQDLTYKVCEVDWDGVK